MKTPFVHKDTNNGRLHEGQKITLKIVSIDYLVRSGSHQKVAHRVWLGDPNSNSKEPVMWLDFETIASLARIDNAND